MKIPITTHIQNQVLIRPTTLNEELSYNNTSFNHRTDYYSIITYIDDFLEGKNINRFLILPGIRDVGKSTILFQVYEYLLKEKHVPPQNILYLSADNLKKMSNKSIFDGIMTYLDIYHDSIPESVSTPVFLLIDEAQFDDDWSMTGKIIFDSTKNIFMIFSGSSALALNYNADSARRLLKMPITPLTYCKHLRLKYGNFKNDISPSINELIFDGKTDGIKNIEADILKNYCNFENYNVNEWNNFLKFGGFPSSLYKTPQETAKKIIDVVDRVVTTDMKNIEGLNGKTQDLAFQILYFFALQNPGEISKGSMANNLDSNKPTITKLLDILEKTQLIFKVEAFTSSPKRTTKPKKYYFATSSIKHVLSMNLGNASLEDKQAYMGKLLENFVASSFFNLEIRSDIKYKTYYDAGKGYKNVDFIVQRGLEKPIPIEVSCGEKDKSQIKRAMSKYKSTHGVIISNTTANIDVDDNIIYMPPQTFAFL